jgi:hypothetical protein
VGIRVMSACRVRPESISDQTMCFVRLSNVAETHLAGNTRQLGMFSCPKEGVQEASVSDSLDAATRVLSPLTLCMTAPPRS